jgi:hypothetical protein
VALGGRLVTATLVDACVTFLCVPCMMTNQLTCVRLVEHNRVRLVFVNHSLTPGRAPCCQFSTTMPSSSGVERVSPGRLSATLSTVPSGGILLSVAVLGRSPIGRIRGILLGGRGTPVSRDPHSVECVSPVQRTVLGVIFALRPTTRTLQRFSRETTNPDRSKNTANMIPNTTERVGG